MGCLVALIADQIRPMSSEEVEHLETSGHDYLVALRCLKLSLEADPGLHLEVPEDAACSHPLPDLECGIS